MSQSAIVTLLSDFGTRDAYVASMKGAIAQINPALTVVDLTHTISPQDIAQARFVLMSAFPYFPAGTVHVAVVDPGVGGDRCAIALAVGSNPSTPTGFLVGPDNGLLSGVLQSYRAFEGVELTNPIYWLSQQTSHTFHGRDLFAPVAAHLASGVSIAELGTAIDVETVVQLPLLPLVRHTHETVGCIQAIDHFGNLITNIPASEVADGAWSATVGDRRLAGTTTYSDRPIGSPIALIGSHGWIEIAVNCGSAQAQLKLNVGDAIKIVRHNSN